MRLLHIWRRVLTHDCEHFEALSDREALLLADVEPLALFVLIDEQHMIIRSVQQFFSSNHSWRLLVLFDGLRDPLLDVDLARIVIFLFQSLSFIGLELVRAALVLFDNEATMLLNLFLETVVLVAAFRHVEHYS